MTRVADAAQKMIAEATLEELVTSRAFFGLTTASNVQRAFCRVADGVALGPLWDDPAVRDALGGVCPEPHRPFEVAWLASIRSAKSLIAAAACVRWSQCVDLDGADGLGPGEVARIPVLSLDKDKAGAVLEHLIGRVMASPLLRLLVVGNPRGDGLDLRHPSGRVVEAVVAAGKRAGGATVSRWLAGIVFDEFPRMLGHDDAVVNWDETRNAAMGRVRKGGQMFHIGSPHAPFGPAHEMFTASFGKPTRELVVMRSPGWSTNPIWWTPERVEHARRTNPDFKTDVAADFASPEEAFFAAEQVEAAERQGDIELPRRPRATYAAYMDPATRGNAWTLVVVSLLDGVVTVAVAREWVGSRDIPIDPKSALRQIARLCESYGISSLETDQWLGDGLVALAGDLGEDEHGRAYPTLTLHQVAPTAAQNVARARGIGTRLTLGTISLAQVTTSRPVATPPRPGEQRFETTTTRSLSLDLKRMRKQVTQAGAAVKLPKASDGRHCDFAPPMLLAIAGYLEEVAPEPDVEAEDRYLRGLERRFREGDM